MRNLFTLNLKRCDSKAGFTIIETMIAVALFLVVVLTGMDALLNANRIHQKSQDMRTILDSLSFMMEDISRNIRTGSSIRCINEPGDFLPGVITSPKSCESGGAIAFEYQFGDPDNLGDQWVYKIESVDGVNFNVSKSTNSGLTWVQLNPGPNEVLIDATSSFSVLGAEGPNEDDQQPLVNIRLSGKVVLKNNVYSPFSLQTSISQRVVDSDSVTIAGGDTVWFSDSIPPGATPASDGGDNWNWVSSDPRPFQGNLAHQSNSATGVHQHYFTGATTPLPISVGDTMVAYIYLNPSNPPSEVMMQWNVSGDWEHRAYWGANNIPWGTDDTVSRMRIGSLPPTGQWVRLEVPASDVGLEGLSVTGAAFTLYDGQATWDSVGRNP